MTCLLWWHSHFATAATGHDCTVCPAGGEHWYGSDVGTFSVCNILTQPEAEPVAVRVRTVLCLRSITSGQNQTKTNCWVEKCPLSLFKVQNTQPKNKKPTKKQKTNTASDLLEYKNLQGWFEYGERDEQKLCKLIKWPLRGPWLLPGRQSPIWMCNDAKWLVSDSIRVCQLPRQIMSCLAPLSGFCTRPQRVQNYFEPGEQSVKLISKSGTFRFVVMCLDTWRYTARQVDTKEMLPR